MFCHFFGVQDPLTIAATRENATITRLTRFLIGYTTLGRMLGIWGKLSLLISKHVQCKGNLFTRPGMANSRELVMGFKQMQLQTMGTQLIFIFEMNP